jgi:hypothetical protein
MLPARFLLVAFPVLATFGCSLLVPGGKAAGSAQVTSASPPAGPAQALKDRVRNADKTQADAEAVVANEELDKAEKSAVGALDQVLGKAPQFAGGPVPESSTAVTLALRKSPIKVRIEPVTDADGNAFGDNFLRLKDSFTDRLMELQRKLTEQRASKAEKKEVMNGSKYVMKLSDLRSGVTSVSFQAYRSNTLVQSQSLTTMVSLSQMIGKRRNMDMELSAEDYARAKGCLERARRGEALAASMTGMLAAYQAVLNDGADPKALDAIAEATRKAFPLKVTVSDDEAKSYLDNLGHHIAEQKTKYEQMMRKTYGDARYEKLYKASVDGIFRQAASAESQPSSSQAVAAVRASRATASAGAAPAGGGVPMTGTRDAKSLVPDEVNQGLQQVHQGLGVASAVQSGDVSGALAGAAKVAPADGPFGSSLAGISALSKGDPRGAFKAALELAPMGGPLKQGLSFATALLFGSDDAKR